MTDISESVQVQAGQPDTASPDELDRLQAIADAAREAEAATIADTIEAAESVVAVNYQSALTCKSFLPPGDPAWLAKEMLGKARGQMRLTLGRIMGTVTGTERRANMYEGKELISVELKGRFDGLAHATGELLSAESVFLPKAFAQRVENQLRVAQQLDPSASISMDIEIGAESTGKQIAFTWTVTHYVDARAMLARLTAPRNVLNTPTADPAIAAPAARPALPNGA